MEVQLAATGRMEFLTLDLTAHAPRRAYQSYVRIGIRN